MFYKKGVLKHFVKITGKYLCRRLFLNNVSGLFRHRHFPVTFAKKIEEHFFLLKMSGGCFFQILPKLKKRRKEHTKLKSELKTRQNTDLKLL